MKNQHVCFLKISHFIYLKVEYIAKCSTTHHLPHTPCLLLGVVTEVLLILLAAWHEPLMLSCWNSPVAISYAVSYWDIEGCSLW